MCTWEDSIFCCFQVECLISSIQFSLTVISDPLWPHGPQHTGLPCPSPTPGVVQTHVHWASDAIQPSHLLSSPSPPAFNLSQHQGLYKWVSSSHQVAFKQGDNIQPWCTPFPISNQSVVPCPVLTVASRPAYRFLKKQVRWSGIPIYWRIFHSLCWKLFVPQFHNIMSLKTKTYLVIKVTFRENCFPVYSLSIFYMKLV